MTWRVVVARRAAKVLQGLHPRDRDRVAALLQVLAQDPRPHGAIQLKGSSSWRARAGDHRIVYDIEDDVLTVYVIDVGHRREIYR